MPIETAFNIGLGQEKSQIAAGYSTLQITTPDNDFLTHRRVALLEPVQNHIRPRDMLELVNELAEFLDQYACFKEQFRNLHIMKLMMSINY